MSEPRKEVKVSFSLADLELINHDARCQGVSRQQLIHDRVLATSSIPSKPGNVRFDRNTYAKAVEAAAQATPGVPRTQLEWAVSRVINSIAS